MEPVENIRMVQMTKKKLKLNSDEFWWATFVVEIKPRLFANDLVSLLTFEWIGSKSFNNWSFLMNDNLNKSSSKGGCKLKLH